jgi:hypoxanthine-DNA glycosylase
MLTGLPPLVSSRTRLLILGSFPGVASLQAQQYYGHPQNHFWRILQAIWPDGPIGTRADSYQIRSEWLLSKRLGVWDVYAACEREGSLDSNIRKPEVNDFAELLRRCPELEAIAHNGGESFKQTRNVRAALEKVPAVETVQFYRLPSTSPANASWSFERKLAAWREVFQKHRLTD